MLTLFSLGLRVISSMDSGKTVRPISGLTLCNQYVVTLPTFRQTFTHSFLSPQTRLSYVYLRAPLRK